MVYLSMRHCVILGHLFGGVATPRVVAWSPDHATFAVGSGVSNGKWCGQETAPQPTRPRIAKTRIEETTDLNKTVQVCQLRRSIEVARGATRWSPTWVMRPAAEGTTSDGRAHPPPAAPEGSDQGSMIRKATIRPR